MRTPTLRPDQRPKNPTALYDWLKSNGVSQIAFAQMLGVAVQTVHFWMYGQVQPSLVSACKMERATKGGVPVTYWLETPMGKAEWGECQL